jgi:hypothetical protein
MKKRTLHTTKILAVVLTSLTGCTERPATPAATAEPHALEAPAAALSATRAAPGAQAALPVATAAPPERPMSTDPKLLALASELYAHRRHQPLADIPRYRPLCDADGYPLVGNVAQGKGDTGTQPSELCALVREKKASP